MRIIFRTTLFVFTLALVASAQIKVTINATVQNINSSESVYLAGSIPQLGNWNPALTKMNEVKPGYWSYSFEINKPDVLEFKFTKGSWSQEAANSDGMVPGNNIAKVQSDTVLEYNICCWSKAQTVAFKGQITGDVEYIRGIGAGDVLPRDIIILLPEGYKTSSERYPVLYMHDGQNIFDPTTVGFGVDWQIDEALDSLTRQGKVQKMIVVGVYNSRNRREEYSNSPLGNEYMKFLVNKVKPVIDSLYRTKPGRDYTWTAGSSMGGLISFMLLWEYNDIFSRAGCFSPAFKIDRFDYVSTVRRTAHKKKDFKLYIDNGGLGLEARLQPGIDEMVALLEEIGYKEGTDFVTVFDPMAEHNEPAWAKRVPAFLVNMFGK